MVEYVILIPPSEGKVSGGKYPALKQLNPQAQEMYDRILAEKKGLDKLYGLKAKALDEAKQVNKEVLECKTLPAIFRYNGTVYKGIDYENLNGEEKQRFDKRVLIASGLFGLIKANQLIPNYRLKIDKLDAAAYWKPFNSAKIKDKFVFDLLPKAHRDSVEYEDGIEVDFYIQKGTKLAPAGHSGKLVKGKLVHWMIHNKITDPNQFRHFEEDGYRWNGKVFVQK